MARNDKPSTPNTATVRRFRSDVSDEWAPPDDELGLTLSQVLHRPSRKRPSPNEVKPKRTPAKAASVSKLSKTDSKALQPTQQTTSRELTNAVVNESVALSDSESDTAKEQAAVDAQHIAAISAMFDDSDNDDNVLANVDVATGTAKEHSRDSQLLINSQTGTDDDESNIHTKPASTDQTPAPQMDFMDEESARNYQMILENTKRERAERRRTFRASGSLNNNETLSTTATTQRANSALAPTRLPPLAKEPSTSADELPDDPLADSPRSARHTTPSKRKRHAPLRICDSEASDDNEVLDEHRILDQRLRTKPKLSSATPSRFELARLNMERETYASDSDKDDVHSIDGYDSGNGAGAVVDTLDTDSEPERLVRNAVMVIRDSSDDDDDFISDPEDHRPLHPRVASRSKESKQQLSSFISQFEPGRRKQMQQRLNRKSNHSGSHYQRPSTSPKAASKLVKGYSQDLDDDIADFIVDDDDADAAAAAASEEPTGRTAGNSTYDSDVSARPRFSREGPRGVMSLMPDEFSLFDLPTSFKAYVQYLVYWIWNGHKKPILTETIARYFFQSYIAVARVIDSVEQSVVASSAWVEPFRTSLHSYPDYAACSIMGTPGCDACHFHSNRTATFCVTLSGTPYKRATLAPPQPGEAVPEDDAELDKDDDSGSGPNDVVTIDDDSDDPDDTESPSDKSNVRPYAEYNLGRVCKMRSEICHELHHYFYNLAHTVEARLETLDYESANPSMGERGREDVPPDDLVEMLDSQGDMDLMFQEFKDTISRAKSGFTS